MSSEKTSESAPVHAVVMRYEVWYPDGECPTPKFATWKEALTKQVAWNRDCPGHVARRIKAA
jgi:hypothetical protein